MKARKVLNTNNLNIEEITNIEKEFRVGPVADSVTRGHEELALFLISVGFSFEKDYKDSYLQSCNICYQCRKGEHGDCDDLQAKTDLIQIGPEAEIRKMSNLSQFLKEYQCGIKRSEDAYVM